MRRDHVLLRLAALVEALSLAVLLTNLATAHLHAISSIVGPLHGCGYLLVIATTLLETTAHRNTRLLALVPGIGGYLVLKRLTMREAAANRG